MNLFKKIFNLNKGILKQHRRIAIAIGSILLALALILSGLQLRILPFQQEQDSKILTVGTLNSKRTVFDIGFWKVEAATTPDYTCDGTADDIQIQAAWDALPAYGKLEILPSIYNITNTITLDKENCSFSGSSKTGTILKPIANFNDSVIDITAQVFDIGNFKIDGNSPNQSTSGTGIDCGVYTRRSTIHDIWFSYCKTYGLHLHHPSMDLKLRGLDADYCGTGLYMEGHGGYLLTDIYITNCVDAVVIAAQWVNLVGFRITTCTGRGIYITNVSDMEGGAIEIGSGDIDSCAKQAIEVYADAYNVGHIDIHDLLIDENSMDNSNVYDDIYVHQNGSSRVYDVNIHDNWIYGPYTKYLIEIEAGTTYGRIHDNMLTGGLTGNIKVPEETAVTGADIDIVTSAQHSEIFMDVLDETTNNIVTAWDLNQAPPQWPTIASQPDVPRNVVVTITDNNTSISDFKIIVFGTTAKGVGNTVQEQFLTAGGLVQVGKVPFATITEIYIQTMTGRSAGDTLDIGLGSKLGLSNKIYSTSDVYKIKKNNANATVATAQVNTSYDTYDMSVIGIAGGDNFTIWYKSSLNKIQ